MLSSRLIRLNAIRRKKYDNTCVISMNLNPVACIPHRCFITGISNNIVMSNGNYNHMSWINSWFTPSFTNVSLLDSSLPTSLPTPTDSLTNIEFITSNPVVAETLGNYPSHYAMYLIDSIHNISGLPYWETIIGVTIFLRVCLLPITLKAMLNSARMQILQPEVARLQKALTDAKYKDPAYSRQITGEMAALFKSHKVNPFAMLMMPLIQLPVFITFYMALSTMSQYYPGLKTGGAFWFVDLSLPDPYFILPIVNGISFLLMIELGAETMATGPNAQMTKNILRGVGVIVVPFTASIPEVSFTSF